MGLVQSALHLLEQDEDMWRLARARVDPRLYHDHAMDHAAAESNDVAAYRNNKS
jgi:hypothetical protein